MPCGCAVFTPSRALVDLITRGVSLFGGTPRLFFGLMLLLGAYGGGLGGRVADAAPATTVAPPITSASSDGLALPEPIVGAHAADEAEEAKDLRPCDGASTTDDHGEPTAPAIKQPWLQATLSIVLLLSTYLLFTLRTR